VLGLWGSELCLSVLFQRFRISAFQLLPICPLSDIHTETSNSLT